MLQQPLRIPRSALAIWSLLAAVAGSSLAQREISFGASPPPAAVGPAGAQPQRDQPHQQPPAAPQTDEPAPPQQPPPAAAEPPQTQQAPKNGQPDQQPARPPGLIPLQPEGNIWLDPQKKRVVMVGRVCLREGQLEMFACPQGTKEHESIISVPVKAYVIHAALLALGARPGSPTVFVPEFRPASGTRVDVSVYWTDEQGKRRSAWAQDWVRHWRTGLPMQEHWVFAGSSFWVNEQTGEKYYQAEEGFLICLANFSTAMLDIPVESSDAAGQLVFEAFTERIPPLGTRVTLVLTPRLEEGGAKPAGTSPE